MNLYNALLPALVADVAVALSFFDGRIIDAKVKSELATATHLTPDQKDRVAQMCGGASTLLAFFSNMAIILATAVYLSNAVSSATRPWVIGTGSVILLLLVVHVAHVSATAKLSEIDDRIVVFGLSWGAILRWELLLLNALVFLEAASGMPAAP